MATYQAAAGYRPDLIIGPLDKSAVERLAQQSGLSVPTLALNYGPRSAWGAANLWQFGLAPEDDAAAAAEQAIARGMRRAAVLFADDDWGDAWVLAFSTDSRHWAATSCVKRGSGLEAPISKTRSGICCNPTPTDRCGRTRGRIVCKGLGKSICSFWRQNRAMRG